MSSRLSLWESDSIDDAIIEEKEIEYSPLTPFDLNSDVSGKVYSFLVSPQGDSYLDLKSLRITGHIKVVKVKADGTSENIGANDNISLINGAPLGLFKLASVTLNSTEVASCSNYLLPVKAYLETSLSTPKAIKECYLKSTHLWMEGDDSKEDTVNEVDANDKSSGFAVRKAAFCNNAEHQFSIPLHIDLFSLNKYLIPGIVMKIDLSRNFNNFMLLGSSEDKFSVQLKSLKLRVKHAKVAESISNQHAERILKEPLIYSIPYGKISSHTIPIGVSGASINIAQGKLPSLVLVGFMKQSQLSLKSQNPFVFPNLGVNSMYFTLNGKMIPGIPFTPQFDKNICMREYLHLVHSLHLDHEGSPKDLSIEKFKNNMTLYAINLTNCCSDFSKHVSKENGNLEAHVRFGASPTSPLETICYSLYNSQIVIDKDRHVFFEL